MPTKKRNSDILQANKIQSRAQLGANYATPTQVNYFSQLTQNVFKMNLPKMCVNIEFSIVSIKSKVLNIKN